MVEFQSPDRGSGGIPVPSPEFYGAMVDTEGRIRKPINLGKITRVKAEKREKYELLLMDGPHRHHHNPPSIDFCHLRLSITRVFRDSGAASAIDCALAEVDYFNPPPHLGSQGMPTGMGSSRTSTGGSPTPSTFEWSRDSSPSISPPTPECQEHCEAHRGGWVCSEPKLDGEWRYFENDFVFLYNLDYMLQLAGGEDC
jgi:hypothetical protein